MTLLDIQRTELLNPGNWIESADSLLASAAHFEPLIRKYWQANGAEQKQYGKLLKANLMLAGFAIENPRSHCTGHRNHLQTSRRGGGCARMRTHRPCSMQTSERSITS